MKHTFIINKNDLYYLKNSINVLKRSKIKISFIIIYVITAITLWNKINAFDIPLTNKETKDIVNTGMEALTILILVILFIILIIRLSKPMCSNKIHYNFLRIGIKNNLGFTPMLLSKYKENNEKDITYYEFIHNGLFKEYFESKINEVEQALNAKILKIYYNDNPNTIIFKTVAFNKTTPEKMVWKDSYLLDDELILFGEYYSNKITMSLSDIPHILIGGASGSGKTELLKLILMQCIRKNMSVVIADFKGGVDFTNDWHNKCNIITDKQILLEELISITNEIEVRKKLLLATQTSNIKEYNDLGNDLERIIFACDEIAELLDKNGVTKEEKELIMQIENRLSIIARQGRAFGIHLVIATQRPDATILSGQIKNNINYRICGRADDVLSSIILDNTNASKNIPSNSKGLFINHDDELFKAYYYEDEHLL